MLDVGQQGGVWGENRQNIFFTFVTLEILVLNCIPKLGSFT